MHKRPLNPAFVRQRQVSVVQKSAPLSTLASAEAFEGPAKSPRKRWLEYAQLIAVVVAGLTLGMFFQFMPMGQVAIIIYGVIAIVRRIPSQMSFIAALVTLAITGVLAVIGQTGLIAQSFAMYTFLLTIVGVATAARELRQELRPETQITQRKGAPPSRHNIVINR